MLSNAVSQAGSAGGIFFRNNVIASCSMKYKIMFKEMFSCAPCSGSLCDPKVCVGKAMQNRRVIIVSPPSTTALRSALGSGRASLAFDFSLKSELIMEQKLRGSPQVRGNGCLKVCKVDNIFHASGSLCRS